MAGLLKTGLWQGGEVEKLGYIGTAVPHASPRTGLRADGSIYQL
ncbi:DUF5456 family protein [Bacteroides fragilis]|nr:DUF5456 family protein [Bacteroides fragilis]